MNYTLKATAARAASSAEAAGGPAVLADAWEDDASPPSRTIDSGASAREEYLSL